MLNKITSLSGISGNIWREIEKIHNDFNTNYGTIKNEILRLRDEFYESHGLYRLTPNYFEEYSNTEKDMNAWKNAAILDIKGFLLYNLKMCDKAIEAFNKAIQIDPNNAKALEHKTRHRQTSYCNDPRYQSFLVNDFGTPAFERTLGK